MKGLHNKLNDVGEWIDRLIILNFLCMGFSILGLGILAFFQLQMPFSRCYVNIMNKKGC